METSPSAFSRRFLLSLLFAASAAVGGVLFGITLVNCGGENERICTVLDAEWFANGNEPCDRALVASLGTCLNLSRRVAFVDPWVDWALRNQEVLAVDEPINWVSRLGTHNAFNARNDGYPFPNQYWSMTDQLRLGSRHFELDLHWVFLQLRLCHGTAIHHVGCGAADRLYAYSMKEIRNWLALVSQRDQILTIDFEDRSEGAHDEVNEPIREYLGTMTFKPADMPADRLPTFREMIDSGKRFLTFSPQDQHGGEWIHANLAFSFPSGQLVDANGNANVRLNPVARECITGLLTNNPDKAGNPQGFAVFAWNATLFPWVAEDRVNPLSPSGSFVTEAVVELAVRCGIGIVFLDDYARASLLSGNAPVDLRHRHAIWSWVEGDLGAAGDAPILRGSKTAGAAGGWNRWSSRLPSESHPFLCARPRSESPGDPLDWDDRPGNNWRVTQSSGAWADGGLACFEEFGDQWVFSVPVSGYMNVQASEVAAGRDVWLNYNDVKSEGRWVINKRPLADAGSAQQLECTGKGGAFATLDGSASTDPENDSLKYRWTGDPGFSTDPVRTVFVPVGTHTFQLVADDHFSGVSADTVQVQVVDTTAPVIDNILAKPSTLWPPNGEMRPVSFLVTATDVCDPNLDCRVVSIVSSEPNPGRGSSSKNGPDGMIMGPLSVLLRAERLGPNDGRVYTMTIRCTDASGNIAEKTATVTVPHDRR